MIQVQSRARARACSRVPELPGDLQASGRRDGPLGALRTSQGPWPMKAQDALRPRHRCRMHSLNQ